MSAPLEDRYRGHVRRTGNRWGWTVYDTTSGLPVAEGGGRSQETAMIAADSWIRLRIQGD